MGKTTVDLTDIAEKIRAEYDHLGLKYVLSAGLVLFAIQTADDQLKSIKKAKGIEGVNLNTGKKRLQKILEELEYWKRGILSGVGLDKGLIENIEKIIRDDSDSDIFEILPYQLTGKEDSEIKAAARAIMTVFDKDGHGQVKILSEEDRKALSKLYKTLGKTKDLTNAG